MKLSILKIKKKKNIFIGEEKTLLKINFYISSISMFPMTMTSKNFHRDNPVRD